MQKIDFYFFCFYNALYKDGYIMQVWAKYQPRYRSPPENGVHIGALFILYVWTFIIRLAMVVLLKPTYKILFIGWPEVIIPTVIYCLLYYLFIRNNRYNDIYIKYRSTKSDEQENGMKKIYYAIGLPFVLVPALILIIIKVQHMDLFSH